MSEGTVTIVVALIAGLLGAPLMTLLGKYLDARFGFRMAREARTQSLLEQARAQEHADLLAFRQEQSRAMTSLRLEHRTLEEAHRELERRCGDLERTVARLTDLTTEQAETITHQTQALADKDAEIARLQRRVRALERE